MLAFLRSLDTVYSVFYTCLLKLNRMIICTRVNRHFCADGREMDPGTVKSMGNCTTFCFLFCFVSIFVSKRAVERRHLCFYIDFTGGRPKTTAVMNQKIT